jgi:hypothetical protein
MFIRFYAHVLTNVTYDITGQCILSCMLQKLTLTSLTSGGRSVGIVCLWTKSTEF